MELCYWDSAVLEKVYARDYIACTSNIELPYYSSDRAKIICIFFGKGGKKLITSDEAYPKCENCKNKKDVTKRKRKTLTSGDLLAKKKK